MKNTTKTIQGDRIVLNLLNDKNATDAVYRTFAVLQRAPEYFYYYYFLLTQNKSIRTLQALYKYMLNENELGNSANYLIKKDKDFIGLLGTNTKNKSNNSISLQYYLLPDAVGRGYIQEGIKLIENELFGKHRMDKLLINPYSGNHASIKVANRMGYSFEIGNKKAEFNPITYTYIDQLTFSKHRNVWKNQSR